MLQEVRKKNAIKVVELLKQCGDNSGKLVLVAKE